MPNYCLFSKPYRSFYISAISISLIGVAWLVLNITVGQAFVVCPTKLLLHLPCPGCGMTRAILALSEGDIMQAIYYNANSVIILPILAVSIMVLIFDCITANTYMYRGYHAINRYLNNRYFIVLFVLVEALIEYHHIVNGI